MAEPETSNGRADEPVADEDTAEAASDEEIRDELPEDLDAAGFVGPYVFPDNNRRRIPGLMYLILAVGLMVAWATVDSSPLVNGGFVFAAAILAVVGVFCMVSGRHLAVDERDALVAASAEVGFPVGHASAQLGWRGFLSRPTWRILLYSAEEPPTQRGLVLVDGYDGEIIDQIIEDNPEDWSEMDGRLRES
ncbi:MAG: hypothetical protein S0880_20265 [Actinomycetota bacterium]|nr:hypothetical protein [Actinomycetota bacterium]